MSGHRNSGDVGSLEDRCLKEIVKRPQQTLIGSQVDRALFSKRARLLAGRSVDLNAAGIGKTVDTVRVRQRIISKLVEEGRGMAGSFPAPVSFLDNSFSSISLVGSKVGGGFVRDTLSKRCTMLRAVDLTGCFYLRDDSIGVLLERCPLLERLCLRNCRKLTDISLGHSVRSGKNILALDLGGCFNMTGLGVDALCSTHPNVSRFTELNVSGIAVTANGLNLICQRCGSLEILRIGFTDFTEASLRKTLPPVLPRLQSLHVHWNAAITDAFLVWVGQAAPRLEDLDVCGCSAVTFEGLSDLLSARQEATEINENDQWSVFESINVRYTSLSKQDVEVLRSNFEDTKIAS